MTSVLAKTTFIPINRNKYSTYHIGDYVDIMKKWSAACKVIG